MLQEVDAAYLGRAVKPKQFIHIDQSECIMCEGCVDICPWKCTRCQLCVDRCPTGVIILGKIGDPTADGDTHQRTNSHGYGYGMRLA